MAIERTIKLEADVKDALKGIEKLNEQVEDLGKSTKKTETATSKLQKGFTGVGLAFKAMGIGLVLTAFSKLSEAMMKNQVIADTVETVFNSIGVAFKMVTDTLINVYNAVAESTENFDDFYMMETHTEVKFGIGMMYEMAIPLALLLGCKKIVVIGWDLGEPKTSTTDWNHFYNINLGKVTGPASGEIAQKLASTDKLHDWFVEKGIDVKLISDQSFISNKFERIQLKDIS